MKNKTKAKPTTWLQRSHERWPRFFKDMLGRLDIAGDDPTFLVKSDITPETQSYVACLMARGLLSEEPTNSIACISCDAMVTIRRKGAKSAMASALCPCCGAIFTTNDKELLQWRTDWNSFGSWLKDMAEADGEIEIISSLAVFLGHVTRGQERFEIYLAKSLWDQGPAKQAYSAISQSMSGTGIVISLAGHFFKPTNPKILVVSLSDCLVMSGGEFAFAWPEYAFSGKDPTKQRSGFMRVQNDPRQKNKEELKAFVRKNITSIFADKYHHQIANEIIKNYLDQITYKDRSEKTQPLSRNMVLGAIKEVMRENGLEDWISGKKFAL